MRMIIFALVYLLVLILGGSGLALLGLWLSERYNPDVVIWGFGSMGLLLPISALIIGLILARQKSGKPKMEPNNG